MPFARSKSHYPTCGECFHKFLLQKGVGVVEMFQHDRCRRFEEAASSGSQFGWSAAQQTDPLFSFTQKREVHRLQRIVPPWTTCVDDLSQESLTYTGLADDHKRTRIRCKARNLGFDPLKRRRKSYDLSFCRVPEPDVQILSR